MKKLISLILCIIFILSFSIVANAENLNDKIAPDVIEKMEKVSDNTKLPLYIHLRDTVDDDKLWEQALAQCEIEDKFNTTKDKMSACLSIYRKLISAAYKDFNMGVISQLGIPQDDIRYCGSTSIILADVECSKIYDVSAHDDVMSINYDHGAPVVITEDLKGLYEEQFIYDFGATGYYRYDELYYHFDTDGAVDWVLVYANAGLMEPSAMSGYTIGDVAIGHESIASPFMCCYGLYDVALQEFIDLYDIREDYSKYEGLLDALSGRTGTNQYSIVAASADDKPFTRPGMRLVGDADFDGEISILDAATIQRILAQLSTYVYDFNYYGPGVGIDYFHDYDKDGEMTILDATAIQRKLAMLD